MVDITIDRYLEGPRSGIGLYIDATSAKYETLSEEIKKELITRLKSIRPNNDYITISNYNTILSTFDLVSGDYESVCKKMAEIAKKVAKDKGIEVRVIIQ